MLNRQETRQYLKESDFENLFNKLGWDNHTQTLNVRVDETEYQLTAIAQKRGMVVFECPATETDGRIPDYTTAARYINRLLNPSTNTLSSTPTLRKPQTSISGLNANQANRTHAANTAITVTNTPVSL